MGIHIFDQYSLLHFASGVIAYFFGLTFNKWLIIHFMFEILENTQIGMKIINKYFFFWPGGKPYRDTNINILGDNISSIIGWYIAYKLDEIGKKRKWYIQHI